ncbi:MAG: type 1 glutamine amidotransferase, partial [Solirubrobacteraceae bacterium]
MTERKWLVIQHVPFEGPGLIAELALREGLSVEVCRVFEEACPTDSRELAGLVVMGGPMGVNDTSEHPHLTDELKLIQSALALQKPILGVCLGAQLLAHALGARVYPGESQEIGWGTVTLTLDGRSDPVLGAPAAAVLPVFHWHGETFDLPDGAVALARSERYANQAFGFGRCAYGFQFHVEVDRELVDGWQDHLPAGIEISELKRAEAE